MATVCVHCAWPTCFVFNWQELTVAHKGASHMQIGYCVVRYSKLFVVFWSDCGFNWPIFNTYKTINNCFFLQTCFQASGRNGNMKIGDMLNIPSKGLVWADWHCVTSATCICMKMKRNLDRVWPTWEFWLACGCRMGQVGTVLEVCQFAHWYRCEIKSLRLVVGFCWILWTTLEFWRQAERYSNSVHGRLNCSVWFNDAQLIYDIGSG